MRAPAEQDAVPCNMAYRLSFPCLVQGRFRGDWFRLLIWPSGDQPALVVALLAGVAFGEWRVNGQVSAIGDCIRFA